MTTVSIAPSPSQWASAALHLDRRPEWRFVRIDGTRYAVLTSGTSGKTYTVRADAAGCGCAWYVKTGQQCSHMLSLELAATEDDLTEQRPASKRSRYERLFPACPCGDLADGKDGLCYRCASDREWQARRDARAN